MLIRPAQPIATANKPQTDRRAVFVALDNESGIVDLLIPQRNERFGQLRCIYIDTSTQDSSGNGCTIQTDIGQSIVALAQTQGYYPVFVPFVSKLKISSNETANIVLLDFDVQPATWPTSLQASSVPNPLHVVIDDQPIATNATVQNWPASQHVTVDGQPLSVDSTVQNWLTNFPVSQNSSWVVSQGGSWAVNALQSGAWSVSIANFPATQAVSISNLPIGVTQSGAWSVNANITNTSLSVAQSGAWNVAATQSGSWNVGITGTVTVTWSTAKPVSVSNFPAVQAVSQSGTWNIAVSNFPATQPVSGSVSLSGQPIACYASAALQIRPFTSNTTANIINAARNTLTMIQVVADNLTNTVAGNLQIKDGSGNLIMQKIIPVLSAFSGVLFSIDNLSLALTNAGNSGTATLVGANITGGFCEVVVGAT